MNSPLFSAYCIVFGMFVMAMIVLHETPNRPAELNPSQATAVEAGATSRPSDLRITRKEQP